MDDKTCIPFAQVCFKNRFIYLFISILVVLVISPIIESIAPLRILFSIFITAVIVSATYALSQKTRHIIIASALALPALGFMWASDYSDSAVLFLASHISNLLFFLFIVLHILMYISGQKVVSRDLIVGAAVVYLLMAVIWSYIYLTIETIHPGAFNIPENHSLGRRYLFIYYSLVTISTLGYGDMTPAPALPAAFPCLKRLSVSFTWSPWLPGWSGSMWRSPSKARQDKEAQRTD